MTFQQELSSWLSLPILDTASPPSIGSKAPSTEQLSFPRPDQRPTIVVFLRHCGCPFAEHSFKTLRSSAEAHPSLKYIAVSHSTAAHTLSWLEDVGGPGPITVVTDTDRRIYAAWGLGVTSFWHVLNPWSMWSVIRLGRDKNVWNRPTESGSRWQGSGWWAVDGNGIVRWGKAAEAADQIGVWDEGARLLENEEAS